MTELINLGVQALEDDDPILSKLFPHLFVKGLVPFNPARWPSYIAGSAMGSEMPEFSDKIKTPWANLQVMGEYLESSKSDVQYRDRMNNDNFMNDDDFTYKYTYK